MLFARLMKGNIQVKMSMEHWWNVICSSDEGQYIDEDEYGALVEC